MPELLILRSACLNVYLSICLIELIFFCVNKQAHAVKIGSSLQLSLLLLLI